MFKKKKNILVIGWQNTFENIEDISNFLVRNIVAEYSNIEFEYVKKANEVEIKAQDLHLLKTIITRVIFYDSIFLSDTIEHKNRELIRKYCKENEIYYVVNFIDNKLFINSILRNELNYCFSFFLDIKINSFFIVNFNIAQNEEVILMENNYYKLNFDELILSQLYEQTIAFFKEKDKNNILYNIFSDLNYFIESEYVSIKKEKLSKGELFFFSLNNQGFNKKIFPSFITKLLLKKLNYA